MTSRTRRLAVLIAVVAAVPMIGRADDVTVNASVTSGSRTMSVKSLAATPLSSIALGSGAPSPFIVNVTDVAYGRAGYQVSANLSDLYSHSDGQFDCARKIDASNLSLSFVASPTSATGIGGLVQPVWQVSGTLVGALATTLGVANGTNWSAASVAGNEATETLSGAFSGLESSLPMSVSSGTSGAFSSPAAHSGCAPGGGGGATTLLVMSGGTQNHASMFNWVQNAVVARADENANGTVTGAELVSSGSVGSAVIADATRTALGDAGVNLALLDTLVAAGTVSLSSIYDTATATLVPVASLAGQSGTYVALPKLSASIPSNTPAGTYRGTLTLTLVDL